MCAQFDLDVMCKRPKKKKDHLVFMVFGLKKFIVKKTSKKGKVDV